MIYATFPSQKKSKNEKIFIKYMNNNSQKTKGFPSGYVLKAEHMKKPPYPDASAKTAM